MWTRKDYENAAQKIGEDFVMSGCEGSINDRALKVAEDAALNPEGIRTMVRLANVAAFEKFFEKGAAEKAPDRMIDFAIGDPEVVISQLHTNAKEAQQQEKQATSYDQVVDYFSDVPKDRAPLEKNASAIPGVELTTPQEKLPTKAEVLFLFKRAEDRMREEQGRAQMRWFDCLEKAANILRTTDSRISARTAFEKNAASMLGEDILPELRMIQKLTSPKDAEINLFGGEKTATVLERHIASISKDQEPIISLLKEANSARKVSKAKENGLEWIANNRERVNK